jgi:hypothetical protein
MRRNLVKTLQSVLLASLLMPAGMLLATETYQPPAVTSSTANWYDVDQASRLFNQMQTNALHVTKEVGALQIQGTELPWQADSARLARARNNINIIGNDLLHLDQMRSKLEPWQQSLLHKVTPAAHEMVYQADVAINTLNAHQNRNYLALSQYPQNIDQIYKNANQMANTIQTVTQYAHAEQKMAELSKVNRNKEGS